MTLLEKELENVLEIANNKLDTSAEEAYKALRTNIRFCGVVNEIKTLTITSCTPQEGKTTTSINLAISMANAGLKTLLIDTDLRLPMIEKVLSINTLTGITDYITRDIDIDDVIIKTDIENLFIIPCGIVPPNPAELLGTKKFANFVGDIKNKHLEILKGKLDMIIFDAPPLGSVIDAAILSSLTDGALLVIKPKSTNYKLAIQVKEQLEKANAHILGVILNNVTKKDLRYGYYYRYRYDYYDYFNNDKRDVRMNPLKYLFGYFTKKRTKTNNRKANRHAG